MNPTGMPHDVMHVIISRLFTFESWLIHQLMHLVGVAVPAGFAALLLYWGIKVVRHRCRSQPVSHRQRPLPDLPHLMAQGLVRGVFRYIYRHTARDQVIMMAVALLAMPILYATLELPKRIINDAIDSGHFPIEVYDVGLSQVAYLFLLCTFFLFMVSLNSAMKYFINVYKGRVAESLICRMRLQLYRSWRSGAPRDDGPALIPVIVQEVEPVGGFAGEALAVPVLQGGTFVTILTFMIMQDQILGWAAVALLPFQLAIVPHLQRRINRLARQRAKEVRVLGSLIAEPEIERAERQGRDGLIAASLMRIKTIRFDIHRRKFFMKSLNNFISHLTPFLFYLIGGYLVIQERLTFGALVAVIAAHKDFSPPLRELFGYYQIMEDVRIRYEEIRRFLAVRSEDQAERLEDRSASAPVAVVVPGKTAHQLAS